LYTYLNCIGQCLHASVAFYHFSYTYILWVSCGLVNFCWSSPTQSFMVPSPVGLVTMLYSLTILGVIHLSSLYVVQSSPANCCWPSSERSFLVSGAVGPMTKFMFVQRSFMCLELGSPLRREEGFVFLSRRHICCTVISCSVQVRVFVLYGEHTRFIILLQLIVIKQDIIKSYVSAGFCSRLHLNLLYYSKKPLVI
jgi:hypothetical protein